MQFSMMSKKTTNQSNVSINNQTQNKVGGFSMMPSVRMKLQNREINETPVVPKIEDPSVKNKWGQPTWFLFHTLAEKIKPEAFHLIKTDLLNNIYAICTNLPCPVCAEHAKKYMMKINFDSIVTKADLKNLLFNFHNEVNKKKDYDIFPRSELDNKYLTANTVTIIQYFIIIFATKYKSTRLINNDFYRTRMINSLKEWFVKNIQYFNP
jgi:hypothetical protein